MQEICSLAESYNLIRRFARNYQRSENQREKAGGFMVRFIEGITRRQALMMTPVREDRLCDDAIG